MVLPRIFSVHKIEVSNLRAKEMYKIPNIEIIDYMGIRFRPPTHLCGVGDTTRLTMVAKKRPVLFTYEKSLAMPTEHRHG